MESSKRKLQLLLALSAAASAQEFSSFSPNQLSTLQGVCTSDSSCQASFSNSYCCGIVY